jgi:asparagine synthase (glutamine-hydrolysing)
MCGIAGILLKNGRDKTGRDFMPNVKQMCQTLVHRGPDDEGYFSDDSICLGMRRLSVIDIDTGQQPISNETGDVWVVHNGEIYNYLEIRKELEKKGYRFRTESDTEVVANAYVEYGPEFICKLNGMFATAVWDERQRCLYLYRDRIGIKPLYFFEDENYLLFSSELHAILSSGLDGLDLEINMEAINYYLIFGVVPAPFSIYRRIRKVLPGHYMKTHTNHSTLKRYWSFSYCETNSMKEDDVIDEVNSILIDSVKLRLRSDVPVGAFLSGGVDSSAIAACAAQLCTGKFKTFSIGYQDKTFDESRFAKKVAEYLGVQNETLFLDDIDSDKVLDIMASFDEPFYDFSAIPTYYVSKLARKSVTVALSGDGGDELFSGYNHYRTYLRGYNRVKKWKNLSKKLPILKLLEGHPRFAMLRSLSDYYCKGHSRVNYKYRKRLTARKLIARENSLIDNLLKERNAWPPVSQFSYLDLKNYHPNDILTKIDRMAMSVSLEVRIPLLDYRLVEFAARIPQSMKFSVDNPKKLLKEVLGKYHFRDKKMLDLINRPKHGFNFPLAFMLKNDLESVVYDSLLSKKFLSTFQFPEKIVSRMLHDYYVKEVGGKSVWVLFCLSLWLQNRKKRRMAGL